VRWAGGGGKQAEKAGAWRRGDGGKGCGGTESLGDQRREQPRHAPEGRATSEDQGERSATPPGAHAEPKRSAGFRAHMQWLGWGSRGRGEGSRGRGQRGGGVCRERRGKASGTCGGKPQLRVGHLALHGVGHLGHRGRVHSGHEQTGRVRDVKSTNRAGAVATPLSHTAAHCHTPPHAATRRQVPIGRAQT
jgi:hypothetical protein